MRNIFFLFICLIYSGSGYSQPGNDDCTNALNLCPRVTYGSSNTSATVSVCPGCSDGATVNGNFCFELDNTVWYTFTTNNVGGNVSVDVSGINCLGGAGNSVQLQGVVLEAGVACDESTYNSVSNCETGATTAFTLNAAALNPNSQYYVLLDGDIANATNAAECEFNISVSGPGVDISFLTTVTDEDCGLSNGQIDVNGVNGGAAPLQYSINGGASQVGVSFPNLNAGTYLIQVEDSNGCIYTSDETVGLIGGPSGTIPVIVNEDCGQSNGEILFTNTTGGNLPYSFSINGGSVQASNNFTGLIAGSYNLLVTDAVGCEFVQQGVLVSSNSGITNVGTNITNTFCGSNTGSIVLNPVGGTAPYSYVLNGGTSQTNNTFNNLGAGNYSIVVTDANQCQFTLTFVIEQIDPTEAITLSIVASPSPACQGDLVTVTATAINGDGSEDFTFNIGGASINNGTNSISGIFNNGDVISCQVTSTNPCLAVNNASSNIITLIVEQPVTVIASVTADHIIVCEGDVVTFTATQNGCTTPTYNWYSNGVLLESSMDSVLTISSLTDGAQVTCEVSCGGACNSTGVSNAETISVTQVSADAGPDHEIIQGGSAVLEGTANGVINWTPPISLNNPSILSPTASPAGTTVYTLTATNGACIATDDVTVTVLQPINPTNTITPNGDGTNDTWIIGHIDKYPNAQVTIYDRWGQKVFNTIGYSNASAWDGTNRGFFLPAGTYYYVIDLKTGSDDDQHNGYITVVY